MDAAVSYTLFNDLSRSYIEVHIQIMGSTIAYDTLSSGNIQGQVELMLVLSKGYEIVYHDKVLIQGPVSKLPKDFFHLHRSYVDAGAYELTVHLIDKKNKENVYNQSLPLEIDDIDDQLSMSGIQLLASIHPAEGTDISVKNGHRIEPLPHEYYPYGLDQLNFYTEIYNSAQHLTSDFALSYKILNKDNDHHVELHAYKKLVPGNIIPLFISAPIGDLPSGKYDLLVQAIDRDKNVLLESRKEFLRSNPRADLAAEINSSRDFESSFVHNIDRTQLDYILKALVPVAPYHLTDVLEEVIDKGNEKSRRYYIHKYFYDHYAQAAEESFEKYMEVARVVDFEFKAGLGYGFESDRGYIFLKYGRPYDIISVEEEPSAPPYQIWLYNHIPSTGQSDVKFLFYNPSLAGDDFILLHSTAIGEISNPSWEIELYRDAATEDNGKNINSTTVSDNWNRNARRYFENF